MRLRILRFAWVFYFATMVVACGGGGGGATSGSPQPGVRAALPTLVQDIEPTGVRIDLSNRNYFPAGAGDTWTFDKTMNAVTTVGAVTRTVQSVTGNDAVFVETINNVGSSSTYRRTANGVVSVDPLGSAAPLAARTLVPTLLEYPEPFYAIGEVRRTVRQGEWGADLDGDGIEESFRLEVSQVFVGLETLALPVGSAEEAHFRTVVMLTISPSRLSNSAYTVTSTENSWFAPGIGMVRSERVATGSDNAIVQSPYTLVLTGGTVGGTALFSPAPDGTVMKLALVHNALVFDASRNRYYASLPGNAVGYGNSIASIDPVTGAASYSAAIGSEPFAMALAGDGSALYVGLIGSGEVIKLRLPDMQELTRTRLPASSFYGQLLPENISVSPLDPDVVAVSTYSSGISPRHAGVALIRSGVLQARMTQSHTGSNLIAFDANGQFVYGYNNETTEFGLRRIEVLADGLSELSVLTTDAGFGVKSLDFSAQGLVLNNALYRGTDLALLGRVSAPIGGCRSHVVSNRLVCLESPYINNGVGRLVVADASSFASLSTPAFAAFGLTEIPSQIVVGPVGQVALRFGGAFVNASATSLWLFTSPALL